MTPKGRRRARPARAVIVRSIAEGRAVLAAARTRGRRVVLRSAPGAAATVGAGWFVALAAILREEHPDVAFEASLDCGPNPGLALAALREGAMLVRVVARPSVRAKIADIARKSGARLDSDRRPALDLAAWLESAPGAIEN
jgi:hypothetical protein